MEAPSGIIDLVFDMETADPDDAFTLCLLSRHPWARLRAVTLTPGSRAQVGVVRRLLEELGREDVPVGGRPDETEKPHVSSFHYRFLGACPEAEPDGYAPDLLAETVRGHPGATLLTGAPLKNPRFMFERHPEVELARWVGQGGFAGDSLVAPEHRLAKFEGLETCPTFNFNGDPRGARLLLESERVGLRQLVSKNVCHGVAYDEALHARLEPHARENRGLEVMRRGMGLYLEKRPEGKLFHDPLAACAALDPRVVTLREVELYREKGKWGSRAREGTGTWISVAVDREAFFRALTASG